MKKTLSFIFILAFLFILIACSASNDTSSDGGGIDQEETIVDVDRKLIYKVNLSMQIYDINKKVSFIKSKMNSDEWFDNESVSISYARIVVRIKTSRLNQFLDDIMTGEKIINYEKTVTDVSGQYVDTEARILALELQIERLMALYEKASFNEMLIINQQLSTAQANLQKERGNLSNFDSLIEYSTVNITLDTNRQYDPNESLWDRMVQAFIDGYHIMLNIGTFFIIFFSGLLPFVLVIAPIAIIVYIFRKKLFKKKKKESIYYPKRDLIEPSRPKETKQTEEKE